MRSSIMIPAIAVALVAGLAATSALHAQDSSRSRDHGSMMGGGMMGQGGMMGMMGMMEQMSQMTDHCSQMMSGGPGKPNEQWRKDAPAAPEKQ